jgi:hypothetical protein
MRATAGGGTSAVYNSLAARAPGAAARVEFRIMRMKIVALLMIALSASPAWAAPWGARGRGPERERPQQHAGQPPQRDPRQDQRAQQDEQRRNAMSDEERRGLHRDLDRANRELYRRR